ncbi:MAG: hypothetical protein LJE97_02875 [Betaproteobacteria bacterium]|nr:hypothetical protein [Betaproteobacteria bacterium]
MDIRTFLTQFKLPFDRTTPPYPHLTGTERVIAEAPLGAETAVLTDRRVVVGDGDDEQSFALGQIAAVRTRFERSMREIARGALFIFVAMILIAVSSPARTFLLNYGTKLEPTIQREQAAEGGGLAGALIAVQQGLNLLADVAGALPILGWVLIVLGLVRIMLGAFGRTVVTIFAGSGEFEFYRRGRRRDLADFAREIGKHLSVPRAAG